jgi:polyisoprenoid-binding protein YceI
MATKMNINSSASTISFQVQKLGFIKVKGTAPNLKGEISFDENNLENSSFDVNIDAAAISTGGAKRDEHLKTKDFFSVEVHPEIKFTSTQIQSSGSQFKAIGDLTIIGNTRQIEIPFSFKNGTFSGDFEINRKDFALGKKFPGFFIAKTIKISVVCKIKA